MKIGEIAVITSDIQTSENFIKTICNEIDIKNGVVSFGRFIANDQLGLHLYGISLDKEQKSLCWDIISQKMLGYIVIFNWENQISLETIKPILDQLSNNLTAPVVVVANIKDINQPPIPTIFWGDNGILISDNFRLYFGKADNPKSVRKTMILLVDMLLKNISC